MWHIDQKAVCVDDASGGGFGATNLEQGNVYTIFGIRKGCCEIELDVGIPNIDGRLGCMCCGATESTSIGWKRASRFRPLDPLEDQMERLEKEGEPIEEHQPEIA